MNRCLAVGAVVAYLLVIPLRVVAAEVVPLPDGAMVLDPDLLMRGRPYPTISPEGKWVAYVSQGFVCVCNVESGTPRRIKEVPYSWTWPHFKAPDGSSPATGDYETLVRALGHRDSRDLHAQVKNTIEGFEWTRESDGFVFGVQTFEAMTHDTSAVGYFVTTNGKTTELSRAGPGADTRSVIVGALSADRQFLVGNSVISPGWQRRGPLIWDIKQNRPRATPYLALVPSSTSGRWIGIEKDSRQLVALDEGIKVARRFEEFLPERTFGFQMDWSPDERSIVWRNQIGFDHYSNWEGFRLDLVSGERRTLEGRFRDELFLFTGNGGEFVRFGSDGVKSPRWSGDIVTGAHLTIVPNGGGRPRDVWRIHTGPDKESARSARSIPGHPMLHMVGKGELFAFPLSQFANKRYQMTWHLMDRAGKTWRVPGDDSGEYVTPFALAGFAGGGKLLVAYDQMRLFTVPVSSIMNAANEVE